jgi:hypothetical protein
LLLGWRRDWLRLPAGLLADSRQEPALGAGHGMLTDWRAAH